MKSFETNYSAGSTQNIIQVLIGHHWVGWKNLISKFLLWALNLFQQPLEAAYAGLVLGTNETETRAGSVRLVVSGFAVHTLIISSFLTTACVGVSDKIRTCIIESQVRQPKRIIKNKIQPV